MSNYSADIPKLVNMTGRGGGGGGGSSALANSRTDVIMQVGKRIHITD